MYHKSGQWMQAIKKDIGLNYETCITYFPNDISSISYSSIVIANINISGLNGNSIRLIPFSLTSSHRL